MRTRNICAHNTIHLGCSALFVHTVLFTCVQCAINVRTVQFICIKCYLCELGGTCLCELGATCAYNVKNYSCAYKTIFLRTVPFFPHSTIFVHSV